MVVKTVRARGPRGSTDVEALIEKARAQKGVERILVVYDKDAAAHIYVEGEARKAPGPAARASGNGA